MRKLQGMAERHEELDWHDNNFPGTGNQLFEGLIKTSSTWLMFAFGCHLSRKVSGSSLMILPRDSHTPSIFQRTDPEGSGWVLAHHSPPVCKFPLRTTATCSQTSWGSEGLVEVWLLILSPLKRGYLWQIYGTSSLSNNVRGREWHLFPKLLHHFWQLRKALVLFSVLQKICASHSVLLHLSTLARGDTDLTLLESVENQYPVVKLQPYASLLIWAVITKSQYYPDLLYMSPWQDNVSCS